MLGKPTRTTWLYVANGVGVEEKLRWEEDGIDAGLVLDIRSGIRTAGIRSRRRIETTMALLVVVDVRVGICSCRPQIW